MTSVFLNERNEVTFRLNRKKIPQNRYDITLQCNNINESLYINQFLPVIIIIFSSSVFHSYIFIHLFISFLSFVGIFFLLYSAGNTRTLEFPISVIFSILVLVMLINNYRQVMNKINLKLVFTWNHNNNWFFWYWQIFDMLRGLIIVPFLVKCI